MTSGVICKATVDTDGTSTPKVYIGSTETPFQQQYANHLMDSGMRNMRNELSYPSISGGSSIKVKASISAGIY